MKHAVTVENLPSLLSYDNLVPSSLVLVSVYENLIMSIPILYALLGASQAEDNISHKVMPSGEDHIKFVLGRPYIGWFLITNGPLVIGSVYLTHLNEFGIRIFSDYWDMGYEEEVINRIKSMYGARRYLININPANLRLKKVVDKIGGHLIQHTFEI